MIGRDGGYTTIELLVVMAILGTVLGGVVTLFTAGINADAQQTQRFRSEQDVRLAMDRLRRELHGGCTVASPTTFNTWGSSVTVYFASDSCAAGSHTVSWCTVGSGARYGLYRIAGSSCAGATQKIADYLTAPNVFLYLPPNSHLVTSSSLGLGPSPSNVTTADGSSVLPRVFVDMTVKRGATARAHGYRLNGQIALRNGPRACLAGVAAC